MDEARAHYETGLQLYNEGNFDAALVELQRAYEIAPTYRILYNIGKIYHKTNHYSEAIRDYEGYLEQGGAEIASERRAEVEKDLAVLKSRVASVEVVVNVPGADVSVDDVPVGKAPLPHSLVVDPGRRKISAGKAGYAPATQVLMLAPSDAVAAHLNLIDLRPRESRHEVHVDPGPRNRAIVSGIATGVFLAGATVFGVLALNANSTLSSDRTTFGIDPNTLSHDSNAVKTWSILSDSCTGLAIVGAGFGAYFTWQALRAESSADKPDKPTVGVQFGPTGIGIDGSF